MYALTLMLKRIPHGWAVTLSDGREIVRFRGLCAKRRVLRFLATRDVARDLSHVR